VRRDIDRWRDDEKQQRERGAVLADHGCDQPRQSEQAKKPVADERHPQKTPAGLVAEDQGHPNKGRHIA